MPRSVARRITQFSRSDIIRLMRKGTYLYTSDVMDVRVYPAQRDIGRVLIIVPKKVGNAPTRNTLRRRVRAIFYEYGIYSHGYDWACFIKRAGAHLSYHELRHIICDICLPRLQEQ